VVPEIKLEKPTSLPDCAARLCNLGFYPVPIPLGSKGPSIIGWDKLRLTADQCAAYFADAGLIGCLHTNLACFDIDVTDPALSAVIVAEAMRRFPGALERIGKAPNSAIVLRLEEPGYKVHNTEKHEKVSPDGELFTAQVEVRTTTRQMAVYGPHPETGKPYRWTRGELWETPRESIPELTQAEAQDFRDWCNKKIREWAGVETPSARIFDIGDYKPTIVIGDDRASEPEFLEALSYVPASMDYGSGWLEALMAIHDFFHGSLRGLEAAKAWSSVDPRYNPAEVDKKVAELVASAGPHHCLTFEKLNPSGCAGCPHKGKIKSPIVLGMEIAQAEVEDGEYVVEAGNVETEDGIPVTESYRIPEYPFPFFRGKNGGIWMQVKETEDEPVLVYEHDLYVVKRMKDPEMGEVALFRLHLPHDGVKEFSIPATSISTKDELRKQLSHHGVMATQKQHELLAVFVVAFMKNLQYVRKAEVMRTQFGWVDNDSKFIVGDREITKDGVFYSPPSAITRSFAEKMVPKGTFEKWKEVFNMYAREGLEPHAFAALTAFGSPLLKFTGLSGAIINVIHKSSGSGKSTALFMCNSVWGHPKELSSMWKDTLNAKMMRLGVHNNLPNTIDEITNTSPMEFSDLAYSISQGRGKDRAKSQTNELRANHTKWNNMTLASSNASFYEKLGAAKNSPDGESMRLLEYKIEPTTIISVEEGKQMFDHQMLENYGHAGDIYAEWLVNNLEEAIALVRSIQARIDKEVKFTARERFWSAAAAINIAGGLISQELGLHNYDMKAIYKWLLGMLANMREEVTPPASDPTIMLGDFMNSHVQNMLVVNGAVDARTKMGAMPTAEPRGELLLRFEPDTGDLFIAAKAFKDYCVKFQIHYRDALKQLKDEGVFLDTINKRMSKGMKMDSPAVRALHFNTKKFDSLVPLEALADADRDGNVPA